MVAALIKRTTICEDCDHGRSAKKEDCDHDRNSHKNSKIGHFVRTAIMVTILIKTQI